MSGAEQKRFGMWIVIDHGHDSRWLCRCDCGTQRRVSKYNLLNGTSKSCGCVRPQAILRSITTHGMARTPEHKIWCCMRTRCLNPKAACYGRYGGRGIRICERWMTFENFFTDMGKRPPGMTLERKDNDGPYSKANCEWATLLTQAQNKRNSVKVTYKGERIALSELARRTGIGVATLYYRHHCGWMLPQLISPTYSVRKL